MENSARSSNIESKLNSIFTILSVLFWGLCIYYAWTQVIPRELYGILFLGGIIVNYCLYSIVEFISEGDTLRIGTYSLAAGGTIIITAYMASNYWVLATERVGYAHSHEYVLAAVLLAIILYLSYEEFGITFPALLLLTIFYAYQGNYFPGIFRHAGTNPERLLQVLVLEIDGIYGSLTRLVAAWIALFMLFAGLLQAYGAFDVIKDSASRLSNYIASGTAQSAVVASMIIGSINGSQTANTGITGSFTIPMMKEDGLKPSTSGAIESVASTGGQILPPVMGAAAFMMASLLGLPYIEIVLVGLFPALIFYLSVVLGVHYTALRERERDPVDPGAVDVKLTTRELGIQLLRFSLPIVLLIYLLGIVGYTVMYSALLTTIGTIVVGFGFPLGRQISSDPAEAASVLRDLCFQTIEGAQIGVKILAPIAIVVAAINGIVDLLMMTGVPSKLSLALMELSGGSLILASIMAMIICILLGLGMPTVASYLIVALLITPALINNFLVPELAAHYFVFYSAILAGITPPIATSIAVACGISGGNFWRTCLQAIKLSLPFFILPFVFIFRPEILEPGLSIAFVATLATTAIGALSLIHGLNYYGNLTSFDSSRNHLFRAAFCLLGLVVMLSSNVVMFGFSTVGILLLYVVHTRKFVFSSDPTDKAV
ncbi:TRAP transporter permease [Natronorubrum sp. FCH18a]|uniref:TRAP transporter permease n=1 Tax=Natronorubrum sp. FCH18a TaxID=3447018 RepID=UPI003F518309